MNQRELAAALGIDPGLVSRLKRQGMPMSSVEAAQDWRRRHVAPYAKSSTAPPPPPRRDVPPASAPAAPSKSLRDLVTATPLADPPDVIEAMVRENALLPKPLVPVLIAAIDVAIMERLRAGLDASYFRPVLCELLHHQPDKDRQMSVAAWSVAIGMGLGEIVDILKAANPTATMPPAGAAP